MIYHKLATKTNICLPVRGRMQLYSSTEAKVYPTNVCPDALCQTVDICGKKTKLFTKCCPACAGEWCVIFHFIFWDQVKACPAIKTKFTCKCCKSRGSPSNALHAQMLLFQGLPLWVMCQCHTVKHTRGAAQESSVNPNNHLHLHLQLSLKTVGHSFHKTYHVPWSMNAV